MNIFRHSCVAFLVLLFQTSFTQNTINFETSFLPESNYRQTTRTENQQVMKYKGSKDIMKALKEKGIENPTKNVTNSDMEVAMQTGKQNDRGKFPMTFEYLRFLNGNKGSIPPGTKFYGSAGFNQVPSIDSVSGDLSAEMKQTMIKAMEQLLENYKMPAKTLKVGESFDQITPVNMTISGINILIEIKTTYKLNKVEGGLAYFKIKQVYTFKSDDLKFKITGSGKGKGELVYHIANRYYTSYSTNLNMQMKMDLDKVVIVLDQKTQMQQVTVKL